MQTTLPKLKFKGPAIVINAPLDLADEFKSLGLTTTLNKKALNQNTLVFVNNNEEFLAFVNQNLKHIEPDSVLWIAYPKGSSGIKTNINRDTLRVSAETVGITTVTAISINEIWSALRFRPIDRVGK